MVDELDWAGQAALVNEVYGGDKARYEQDIAEGRSQAMSWQDMEADSKVLPQYNEGREFLYKLTLGYLPDKHYTTKFDASMKVAIFRYRSGEIDYLTFINEIAGYITTARNRELVEHNVDYAPSTYAKYDTFMPEYKDSAHTRFCKILGYKPDVRTSLIAELKYRELMSMHPELFPKEVTDLDMSFVTLIKYRERLLSYGVEEAKKMELLAPSIMDRFNKGEIIF